MGLRTFLTVLAVVALSGCQTPQVADPVKLAQIHAIRLAGFAEPQFKFNHGFLVDIGVPGYTTLNDALASQHLQLGAETKAAVTVELSRIGYKVETEVVAPVDGILNVEIAAATYFEHPPIYFDPTCTLMTLVKIDLKEAKTGRSVLSKTYSYTTETGDGPVFWTKILADSKYEIESVNALVADLPRTADAFRQSALPVAKAIAHDLERK